MKGRLLPRGQYEKHLNDLNGACAFCTMTDDLNIKAYENWVLAYAAYPYRKYHVLLISKRHITNLCELTPEELTEFARITEDVNKMYEEAGIVGVNSKYGDQLFLCWRTRGNDEVGKKSVAHLHLHFYPEASKEINIVLDDSAWDTDLTLLK